MVHAEQDLPDRFDVILHGLPKTRELGVKVVRLATGLELKPAIEILNYLGDNLPCSLISGVSLTKARSLHVELQSLGANADVVKSRSPHPMVLWPDADARFEWRQLYGLTRRP